MRALSIASLSRPMVMVPASTSDTNCLIMSRPRSRAGASPPNRPRSTIWSSRLSSVVCAAACFCCSALGSAILTSLGLSVGLQLRLELLALLLVAQRRLQQLLQLLVALDLAAQVGELIAQVEKLLQRLHLARHPIGAKVVHAFELELHPDLARVRVVRKLVLHRHLQTRLHARQHVVEVVERDLGELPILELRQLFGGMPREVREHPHDEGQLPYLHRAAGLHLVRDVHARRPDALQLLVNAFLGHSPAPRSGSLWGWGAYALRLGPRAVTTGADVALPPYLRIGNTARSRRGQAAGKPSQAAWPGAHEPSKPAVL